MAKPDFASLPASSSFTPPSPSSPSNRVNRIPRSRPRPSARGILTLLATLSASPLSAHAHPVDSPATPLPFLYPPFTLEPTRSITKRSPTTSSANPAASATPPSECQQERSLPDKYVLGDDGRWHKTPWSLYGSSYCPVSTSPSFFFYATLSMSAELFSSLFSPKPPCPCPSLPADVAYNDAANSTGVPSSETTPYDDFDITSLPTGWKSVDMDSSSRHGTFVILALSVALAVIIVAMMLACHFWRRKRVRKRDPEKRGRMISDLVGDDSARSIREAKAAQRKWSKAVSRWRDGIRPSARRRRTNRGFAPTMSPSALVQAITTTTTTESSLLCSQSRSSSPTATQRSATPTHQDVHTSSTASLHSSHSQTQTSPVLASETPPTDTHPSTSPPLRPLSIEPPAYHARQSLSSLPAVDVSLGYTYPACGPSGISKAPLSSHPRSQPHSDDDGHFASLSGHVATDDKAILSLRAALASAPPEPNLPFPQSVSVPSMEEEDASVLFYGSRPSSPSYDAHGYEPQPPYSPPRSLLPPPPLKGKQKFDYYHDLDISENFDITVEPQLGPSAPPFEESEAVPSAPLLEFDAHVPSAPPMDSEG
ncbi:hypothetical protein BC827DRAFT_1265959 [Russula dissimulans]|nr:hypothetical protein BC827DRAFT_1265959 [Russula dissimulans]